MQVSLHRSAELELSEAAQYYAEQEPNLGKEFLDEVEKIISAIRSRPLAYPLGTNKARRVLADRFPFSIHYRVRGDVIRVLAVTHQKRDPAYWKDRE